MNHKISTYVLFVIILLAGTLSVYSGCYGAGIQDIVSAITQLEPINANVTGPIDKSTQAVETIEYEHHEIHAGTHYFVKTWIENTGAVGSGNLFAFTTPDNTTEIHAKALVKSDADVIVEIFEDCNITGGTPVTANNNNRNSNRTAMLQPVAAPTVNSCNTLMWNARNGGGRDAIGVTKGLNYEIIAKRNTTYVFNLTKQTTSDTVIDIDFFWYEHIPKNI